MSECPCIGIHFSESPLAPNPEHPAFVLIYDFDEIIRYGVRILRNMFVTGERLRYRIESIDSSTSRSDPENAFTVLKNGLHYVIAETILISRLMSIYRKIIPIIFVETDLCAEPHISFMILQDTNYRIMRQSLFSGNTLKL